MKKFIIYYPDGTYAGPISEQQLEEDLKNNYLKTGTIVYALFQAYEVKEKHESFIQPLIVKAKAPHQLN